MEETEVSISRKLGAQEVASEFSMAKKPNNTRGFDATALARRGEVIREKFGRFTRECDGDTTVPHSGIPPEARQQLLARVHGKNGSLNYWFALLSTG